MMKRHKISTVLRLSLFLFMASLLILSCKDDDDDNDVNPVPVNPLSGTYSFISASFEKAVTVVVNGDTNNYQIGDDASIFVGGGLLGAAPCDNPENAALELRSDYTSYYVCLGEENEDQQGTWASEVETSLSLFISNPQDFVVVIYDIVLTDIKLTGVIDPLPLPFDASLPVGAPLPGGGINYQTTKVAVEFQIVE